MRQCINDVIAGVCALTWMLRTMWRHGNGRWYVFRDAPDWFVYWISHIQPNARMDVSTAQYIREAQQEQRLRERK